MCNDIQDHIIIQNYFTALKPLCALSIHSYLPQHLASSDLFIVSIVLLSVKCHIAEFLQYINFLDWFFHLVIEVCCWELPCLVSETVTPRS